MKNTTRFMDRLFSATEEKDAELTEQVAQDIENAKANGIVDTDELKYESQGDGRVAITDKGNGEVTMAERAEDGNYDLYPAEVTEQIEGFIHPEGDGVTPGQQVGAPDEHVEEHLDGMGVAETGMEGNCEVTAEEGPEGETCPECGQDPCECGDDEREFSVSTDNSVVLRIFSDQEYCERLFSEVIESEETAKVGDLKIEKLEDEDNTVVVTDQTTGDQAKVTLDDNNMEVTELDSKEFSEEDFIGDGEEYEPFHIVGVDAGNHVLVDTVEYEPEEAQEVAARLSEEGVDAVQIFDNPEEARDYALSLLENLGVQSEEDIDEPEEATFSDHTIYITRFYSDNTIYMDRLFSEAVNDIETSQNAIEDAIENGDEIENDSEIITPIDANTAIVEDKESGEYTKVTIDGDAMDCQPVSSEVANKLMENLEVEDTDEDEDEEEEEKEYSDIWCDEDETRFFSENEYMTEYMIRLFSGDSDESAIEDAIENGDEIENDSEVITPIDSKTAIIEDKESGEYTKAEMDDEKLDVNPISKEEAEELMENLEVEDTDEDEDEEEEEKEYSDIWCDEDETRFFSENEYMTEYMIRLFSEDGSESDIENAIESGKVVNTDSEVITPVSEDTAIIEDKENGEYTIAEMDDEKLNVNPIEEEEAVKMIEESGKNFSYYDDAILDKFFTDAIGAPMTQGEPEIIPAVIDPATGQLVPADQMMPQEDPNMMPQDPNAPQMTVEAMEDKAMAAVQSIQAAAAEAEATILNAKAAPVENQEQQLQEAQFSDLHEAEEKMFSNTGDTLISWLNNK